MLYIPSKWHNSCKHMFLPKEIPSHKIWPYVCKFFFFCLEIKTVVKGKNAHHLSRTYYTPYILFATLEVLFELILKGILLYKIQKLPLRESVKHVSGHKVNKKQSQNINPGFFLTPTSGCFSLHSHFSQNFLPKYLF